MGQPELDSSASLHIGPVREENQDAIRLPDSAQPADKGRLFALADGMGGYAHGALASQLALDSLFENFNENHAASTQAALRRGIECANLRIFKTSQQLNAGRMGTTLTAAYIDGDTLQVGHVGDSRLYLVRDHAAACLTSDHTTVGDLVRMRVLTPDKVRGHAQRSILTRAVGLSLFVKVDLGQFRLQEKDCLVLCSDGLWSVVEDHELTSLADEAPTASHLAQSLIDLALERRTDDNISAVVIYVRRLPQGLDANRSLNGQWWARSLWTSLPGKVTSFLGRSQAANHRQR
jgi:serine/threonine protein phosphatase PrpC